jgi:FtsP/CotA-like multicopper oxidase with cupredoxin domain
MSTPNEPPAERHTDTPEPPRSDRRRFLAAGAASVAGLALASRAAAQEEERPRPTLSELQPLSAEGAETDAVQVLDASTFYQELPQMRVISSHTDSLEATLESTVVERFVPTTTGLFRFQARSYGSDAIGPQLRVRPGQTLRLRFVNTHGWNETNPNNTCPSADHNVPNCLNTTNVHTHGLHVSPNEPSDDVFIQVWPKDDPKRPAGAKNKNGSFDYVFEIPKDHAPGTHWYHAHRHGSTAYNVSQNQFGSLLVLEPEDQRILPGVREETLVLAQALHRQPAVPGDMEARRQGPRPLFTVNGVSQPTLLMRPNEVQRWRFISASGTTLGYNPVSIVGPFKVWLVAWDGITLSGPPRPVLPGSPLVLAPGNRADILIKAPSSPFTGRLDRLGTDEFKTCDHPNDGFPYPQAFATFKLADIYVAGPSAISPRIPSVLPASKAAYLKPIEDREVARSPKRTVSFHVLAGPLFQVGYRDDRGGSFGPAPYDSSFAIKVPFRNVEEWTIENQADQDHPFHIHVNPFQIVEIKDSDGTVRTIPLKDRMWADTVSVPRHGYVKIRSRFVDFKGRYVLHCHILNHEDRGMMMNVEVV